MLEDYIQTVRVLFRDAQGREVEEDVGDQYEAHEELRRAYEEGASEQEACNRLLKLAAE